MPFDQRTSDLWPADQDALLRKHFPHSPWPTMMLVFSDYTRGQIAARARRLGLRRGRTQEGTPECTQHRRALPIRNNVMAGTYEPMHDMPNMRAGANDHKRYQSLG